MRRRRIFKGGLKPRAAALSPAAEQLVPRGTRFMGVDVALLLDEHYERRGPKA